jgi:hypothetical protein
MKSALEIFKLLPKTNCGTCGTPTCFGFAAKVAAGMVSISACGNLSDPIKSNLIAEEKARTGSRGTVYEQALESIRPRVKSLDFPRAATALGLTLSDTGQIEVSFLNERYLVGRDRILSSDGREPLPFISILIYNHLCMPDPPPLSGEWITFSSVPASHAKDKAWAGHVEEVIARHFSSNLSGLRNACERLGGEAAAVQGSQDAAYIFRFFPHYPALLLFYDAVSDEDFPAQCRLLLDKNVDRYLDIESIVVLGEEFAGRLTA